jgi:hypothetical protein
LFEINYEIKDAVIFLSLNRNIIITKNGEKSFHKEHESHCEPAQVFSIVRQGEQRIIRKIPVTMSQSLAREKNTGQLDEQEKKKKFISFHRTAQQTSMIS